MRDVYLTPPLQDIPGVSGRMTMSGHRMGFTEYHISFLEVADIHEVAPQLLALYGLRRGVERVAEEEKRLFEFLRRPDTDVVVARPVGGAVLAADARVVHRGPISMGPTDGRRMAESLFSFMKWCIDPDQYPLDVNAARYLHSSY